MEHIKICTPCQNGIHTQCKGSECICCGNAKKYIRKNKEQNPEANKPENCIDKVKDLIDRVSKCTWTFDEVTNVFETDCGNSLVRLKAVVDFDFCPYCGRDIEVNR